MQKAGTAVIGNQDEVFRGIYGNEAALRSLEGDLERNTVAHAYLFHGPSGVGKRTVAHRFGAALVADGDRAAEQRAIKGLHPDLQEITPDGGFTTIGQIRSVVRLAAGRPFEGARRVFILEADTLNAPAANALLKTLEEPEAGAVFILLASSSGSVLQTVVSRTRQVRFSPAPVATVAEFLTERRVPQDKARLFAELGRGSFGLALRYAGEDELEGLREAVLEAAFLLAGDFEDRHGAVVRIVEKAQSVGAARESAYLQSFEEPDRRAKDAAKRVGKAARDGAVREALDLLSLAYRDAAVVGTGATGLVANIDRIEEIERCVAQYPEADWAGAASEVGEARPALVYNVAPEAILEVTLSRARQRVLEA